MKKICITCNETKNFEFFQKGRNECKLCRKNYIRLWSRANKDKCCANSARTREKYGRPAQSNFKAATPEAKIKKAARKAVYDAVKAGRMPHPTDVSCIDCGGAANQYDHYLGYESSVRLSAQAVCAPCHGLRSRLRGEHERLQLPAVGAL